VLGVGMEVALASRIRHTAYSTALQLARWLDLDLDIQLDIWIHAGYPQTVQRRSYMARYC
jgi:hypothetical protein